MYWLTTVVRAVNIGSMLPSDTLFNTYLIDFSMAGLSKD